MRWPRTKLCVALCWYVGDFLNHQPARQNPPLAQDSLSTKVASLVNQDGPQHDAALMLSILSSQLVRLAGSQPTVNSVRGATEFVKIRSRFRRYLAGELPNNYALTFSRHEKHHHATIWSFLRRGGNVAQVFDVPYHPQSGKYGKLPESIRLHGESFPVIDGDLHDRRRNLRPLVRVAHIL